MILDFKLHEIEIDINNMEFKQALEKAKKYHSLIQSYKEVWGLLLEQETEMFETSRAAIKAELALCRCQIIAYDLHTSLPLNVLARLDNTMACVTVGSDISRINNYKIMWYLKCKQPNKAIEYCNAIHILTKALSIFDLFWFIRSINDFILMGNALSSEVEKIVDFQIKAANLETEGHPIDLIWREISLFELYRQNKSKAVKAIRKSRNASNMVESPISLFLTKLLDIYSDYINNPENNRENLFNNRILSPY